MAAKQVCIDTNILIDLLVKRPRAADIKNKLCDSDVFVSSLSIVTAFYVCSKDPLFDSNRFYSAIDKLHVLGVDGITIEQGKDLANNGDLEDGVQVAAALQGNVGEFMTADRALLEKFRKKINMIFVAG